MDHNQSSNNGENKSDEFYINFENGLGEANELREKRVDDFFDKLENNRRSRIKDSPQRPAGQRYITKDGEVLIYRSDEKEGYAYKAKETGKRPASVGSDRKGVRLQPDAAEKKKRAWQKNKPADPPPANPISDSFAAAGGGRKQQKPLRPARKKSVVVKIIGVIYGIIWRTVLGLICLGVIAGCTVAVLGVVYLVNVTKDDAKILNLNNIELSYASMLMVRTTDENGAEHWEEYQRIFGGENRIWVKYTDMPKTLIDAIVASEDKRFWEHSGVDWKRTIAAFANAYVPGVDIFSTTQGASTIAQQLIKNVTQEDETKGFDGALRKMREIYRAIMMEKEYSREQILESYLNTFRLSGKVAGIEAAANYYFDKETGDLTAAQCAAIICITKAPGWYNPYEYPEANRIQRDTIINQMFEQGYLSESQWNAAKRESANMVFGTPTDIYTGTNIYTYFDDMVIEEVLDDFVKFGFKGCTTRDQAFAELSRGGYRILMTLDLEIQ
ncbi:MAG: penicillin-binding protein, partial [Oscillospiraceae bacterium]|nr:penicillin-binding protein [Oscillospiraceae bacterium]